MSNIERIAKMIVESEGKNILIHSIPKTQNWIVAQKIDENRWLITLCSPLKNVTFNLGVVSDQQHLKLWNELTNIEIENKANSIKQRNQFKSTIKNFLHRR